MVFVSVLFTVLLCACSGEVDDIKETQDETTAPAIAQTAAPEQIEPTHNEQEEDIIEPSRLVSQAEAESIMGVTLGSVQNSEQPAVGLKLCVYESEDRLFQVGLQQPALMRNDMTPQSMYQAIVDNFEDAEKVEGVGEEAYIAIPGIHIMQSGYYITIALGNTDLEENRQMLKQAGEIAVDHLNEIIG